MKQRGFEKIKGYESVNLPIRKTKNSAGYDTEAAEDTIIPPFKPGIKPTLVKTGIKAYCQDNEWIMVANRSSNPGKKHLILANGIGIVDADYYNNEDNEGHIMFAYFNMSDENVEIKKGEVIGQLVFMNYLTADDDKANGKRKGGFGSTSK
ncbi:MAG: dUTP diphosphatase [Bacilli bacterium]|nr:dUTP diphosphatase [Bacilli bacterium]